MEPMVKALGFIVTVSLLGVPLCVHAQGTSQQNYRGGYGGSGSPGTASISPNNNPAVVAPRNSLGTGQGRIEDAFGLTPQHQKELGISKPQ
jgi:hypothetical protein